MLWSAIMKALRLVPAAAAAVLALLPAAARAQTCDPPRILLVMDASSSMLQQISTGTGTTSKWQAVQDAVHAVFQAYPDAAQYGLMTFPGPAGQCSTGTVRVDVGPSETATIESTLGALTIPSNNQTPAGQSLYAASNYAGITEAGKKNYVIFMTDGWQFCDLPQSSGAPLCATSNDCTLMGVSSCPTCNSCQTGTSDPNCSGQTADGCYCVRNWPVLGVQALQKTNVPTYVVGFGSATDAKTLNAAADAGGTALANCDANSTSPSCYLQATSPQELTDALSSIVQAVVTDSCTGECGIAGTRTCTAGGWSTCDAPSSVACHTACGDGVQQCVSGVLGPCSKTCSDGGAGAAGTAGAAGMAGAAGSGAAGAGASAGASGNGGTAGSGAAGGSGGTAGTGASGGSAGNATGGSGGTAASAGAQGDAGPGSDSGAAARGGSGGSSDSGDTGGCGCRTAPGGGPTRSGAAFGALLLGLALSLRRRRR